jgi:hypothetical protein
MRKMQLDENLGNGTENRLETQEQSAYPLRVSLVSYRCRDSVVFGKYEAAGQSQRQYHI